MCPLLNSLFWTALIASEMLLLAVLVRLLLYVDRYEQTAQERWTTGLEQLQALRAPVSTVRELSVSLHQAVAKHPFISGWQLKVFYFLLSQLASKQATKP
ncbi:MAG: hypothetical protein SFZ03_12435 [Candidatus Melainabacteria bacterium]|nr:hypothetical protein [Candidatus Melainabacteria bacterium]